jgi:two-component system, cell cycle sensor histidine kinase and response regulator CckA
MQALAKERVLLVDDEPQVLVALEDLLGDRFCVIKTESAEDALRLMKREEDIAVVVTDQRMPRMTGDELLAQLDSSSSALRIMVTGYADLSAVVRAVNEGRIFAYVTKPWNAEDLCLKVDKAVEQFRLAKELAHERQLLHDLMNNSPDGIYFKDRALKFQRVNRAFAALIGNREPDALVGRRFYEVAAFAANAEAVENEEQRILDEGQPALDVVRGYGTNGSTRWFSETKAPIKTARNDVIGLVGISRDVTERVASAEALQKSEEQIKEQSRILNSILDSMGEGVIVADRSGTFLLFNRQAEKTLGIGPRAVPPAAWSETYGLFLPDQKTPLSHENNPLVRAMAGEKTAETEIFIRNKIVGGATVAVNAAPLKNEQGALVGGVAVLRDVTQQRRLEQQLTQAQKMEAIGRLAGGVAHDFNNLLAVIQSYGDLIFHELPEDDPKREDLGQMLAASERAASLTRQLLAFSRLQIVQLKTLHLNEVVANVEKMLRRIIGEDIELTTTLSPSLGRLKADPGQIEQIILNLTVNARDAMPDGGSLTIETANVELGAQYAATHAGVTAGEFVMLSVTDTGTGMDAATQKRIFEPFFTTKELGKGTGLGLSTVYGIVHQSGGNLSVESEVGRGTSFRIYFPRVDERREADPDRRRTTVAATTNATILLVEDDDAVRQVAARILRRNGYNVLETRRASEARNLCKERGSSIDLLLTDVVMPEISGPKLASEILQLCPELRVLYMSGYPQGAVAQGGSLSTDISYVEKPFTPASLLEKVREVIDSDDRK